MEIVGDEGEINCNSLFASSCVFNAHGGKMRGQKPLLRNMLAPVKEASLKSGQRIKQLYRGDGWRVQLLVTSLSTVQALAEVCSQVHSRSALCPENKISISSLTRVSFTYLEPSKLNLRRYHLNWHEVKVFGTIITHAASPVFYSILLAKTP